MVGRADRWVITAPGTQEQKMDRRKIFRQGYSAAKCALWAALLGIVVVICMVVLDIGLI